MGKEVKSKQAEFKKKIGTLENDLALNENFQQHNRYKNGLEAIIEKIAEGVKIYSKYNWYEQSMAKNLQSFS